MKRVAFRNVVVHDRKECKAHLPRQWQSKAGLIGRGTAPGLALLQLFGFRFQPGDFRFQSFDLTRFVVLLLGSGQLLAQDLQPLPNHIQFLLVSLVHDGFRPMAGRHRSGRRGARGA